MTGRIEQPKSLTALAAAAIRDGIVTGRYPLGAPLYEKALAEEFGVSKTPVREALLQLQREGLVRVAPHSGTYVFEPGPREIREICELRMILEEQGLLLATRRNFQSLIKELRRCVAGMRDAVAADDGPSYRVLDADFHRALLGFADNRAMLSAYATIESAIGALRVHIIRPNPLEIHASLADHVHIVEALENGYEQEAAGHLRAHVGRSRDLFLRMPPNLQNGP